MNEIERQSAVDRTVSDLRELMRANRLGVGDPLPSEAEMAVQFGTSRNTVREAMRILKAYGIVETRQKAGAVITDRRQDAVMKVFSFALDLSAGTFRDIQGFRRMVETSIGDDLVAAIRPELLDELAQLNDAMAAETNLSEAAAIDFGFHLAIVDALGNATMSEIYRMLRPVMISAIETGKARDFHAAVAEHAAILDALRSRDRLAYAYHAHRHAAFGMSCLAEGAPH